MKSTGRSVRSPWRVLPVAVVIGSVAVPAIADSWPQWRGPNRDGISPERGWSSEGRPDNVWSRRVGLGYSSVAVVDGRLYTVGYDEDEGVDTIHCLDAMTGQTIWMHSYPAKKWAKFHGGGTNSTPSVEGDRVFVLNREGRFTCLNASTGEPIWSKDLQEDFGVTPPTWGFAASPLILEGMVVLNVGQTLALDKASGQVKWASEDFGHAYSTPVDFELDGRRHLAVFAGRGLAVIEQETGDTVHRHPWKTEYDVNAATPIVDGNRLFISSGYNHGCSLIDLSGDTLSVLWESKVMRNKMSGCVLWEGHLYGFDENILKCVDLEGNEKWRQRGLGQGALTASDGRLIVMSGKGELLIAEASPEAYKEVSRAKVLDGGVYWTSPVLADGMIYCRNSRGDLACRDHRAASAP